jgi:hypothetical protein
MDEKWRVSRVELLEGGLLYGFVLYDQRAGRVLRSATRTVRKRSWAAIMLRQRLRMQSKFSVAGWELITIGVGPKSRVASPRRGALQIL